MHVILNGEPEYLGSQVAADGGCERDVVHRRDEGWPRGRTGSALVWHTRGRVFEPWLMQQVLQCVGSFYTVQYVELRGHCP